MGEFAPVMDHQKQKPTCQIQRFQDWIKVIMQINHGWYVF